MDKAGLNVDAEFDKLYQIDPQIIDPQITDKEDVPVIGLIPFSIKDLSTWLFCLSGALTVLILVIVFFRPKKK